MNKKTKIILAVSVIVVVATVVGVLCWGLQPVKRDEVSLKKLNKKLGEKYCVPAELPFGGNAKCFIIYNEQHWNLRFEIDIDSVHGYSIELKDSNREIYIETGDSLIGISDEIAKRLQIEYYKDQKIKFLFNDTETKKELMIIFEIDYNTYYIRANYDKEIDSNTLKSDVECLLNQMIKK